MPALLRPEVDFIQCWGAQVLLFFVLLRCTLSKNLTVFPEPGADKGTSTNSNEGSHSQDHQT